MVESKLPVMKLGMPGAERDELIRLVLDRKKRATTGLLADYKAGEALPKSGDRFSLIDSAGQPVCVVVDDEVRVVPFNEVDAVTAQAEGEGDGSLEYWRRAHREFFKLTDETAQMITEFFHVEE